jgi:hypothetical protein
VGRHASRCVIDHGVYARSFAASIETAVYHVFMDGLHSKPDAGHGQLDFAFAFVFVLVVFVNSILN